MAVARALAESEADREQPRDFAQLSEALGLYLQAIYAAGAFRERAEGDDDVLDDDS